MKREGAQVTRIVTFTTEIIVVGLDLGLRAVRLASFHAESQDQKRFVKAARDIADSAPEAMLQKCRSDDSIDQAAIG